jgi:hypothetical protein
MVVSIVRRCVVSVSSGDSDVRDRLRSGRHCTAVSSQHKAPRSAHPRKSEDYTPGNFVRSWMSGSLLWKRCWNTAKFVPGESHGCSHRKFEDHGSRCKVLLDCPTTPTVQSWFGAFRLLSVRAYEWWTAQTFSWQRLRHSSCEKVGSLHCCRLLREQYAGCFSSLAKMQSQWWWMCGTVLFCILKLALSSGIIVRPSSVVISMKINSRHYFWSALVKYSHWASVTLEINYLYKYIDALTHTSKEVGLEVNTEKTKYMSMSHHQNLG